MALALWIGTPAEAATAKARRRSPHVEYEAESFQMTLDVQ